jgi:hypothetical protein
MDPNLDADAKHGNIRARQLCLFDDPGCTDEERTFADEYLVNGFDRTAAVYKARPKVASRNAAKVQAHKWLKTDRVRAYIEQRRIELALAARLEQEEVIELHRAVALAGLGRLKLRKTVVGKDGKPTGEVELYEPNLGAVNTAAAGLAKFLGVDDDADKARPIEVRFVSAAADDDDAGRQRATDPDSDA